MEINKYQVNNFRKLSKDRNRIHFDQKFSKYFFFKRPIVHGVDLVIRGINKFLKTKKNIIINRLNIDFKNYTYVNENFKIKIFKNKILILNNLNIKLEIKIDYKEYKYFGKNKKRVTYNSQNNLLNAEIIEELIFISYYIGSIKPGNGSLIHKINIKFDENNFEKKKISFIQKTKTIFEFDYRRNCFDINIVASKLSPFKSEKFKSLLSKKSLSMIKDKKILIFGASSDLAERFLSCVKTKDTKIYKHKFRIEIDRPFIKSYEIKKIKYRIQKLKPDFILYFSSPNIYKGRKSNKKLLKFYNTIYVDYLKIILNIIKIESNHCKILYPSTFIISKKKNYRQIECYLIAKERAEKLCQSKDYKKNVRYYRFPQLRTRSNYNMLGFYEGKKISVVDKYLNHFFENT